MSQNHITEINVLTLEAVEVELAGHEVATKPFEITIFYVRTIICSNSYFIYNFVNHYKTA